MLVFQQAKVIKLTNSNILLSVKMEHPLNSCIGNGTFELRYGTATTTRTTATTATMEKRQSAGALQQRIQPKRDITSIAF
jgi:hypothetical protein